MLPVYEGCVTMQQWITRSNDCNRILQYQFDNDFELFSVIQIIDEATYPDCNLSRKTNGLLAQ